MGALKLFIAILGIWIGNGTLIISFVGFDEVDIEDGYGRGGGGNYCGRPLPIDLECANPGVPASISWKNAVKSRSSGKKSSGIQEKIIMR